MKKVKQASKFIIPLFLVLSVISYVDLFNYPRIVRGAYYRNPIYAITATCSKYLLPKKITKSGALNRVKNLGLSPVEKPKFLYLTHNPKNNREEVPVITRYFGLISKMVPRTSETLFWQVRVSNGIAIVEATTGNVIYYERDAQHDENDYKYYE